MIIRACTCAIGELNGIQRMVHVKIQALWIVQIEIQPIVILHIAIKRIAILHERQHLRILKSIETILR